MKAVRLFRSYEETSEDLQYSEVIPQLNPSCSSLTIDVMFLKNNKKRDMFLSKFELFTTFSDLRLI